MNFQDTKMGGIGKPNILVFSEVLPHWKCSTFNEGALIFRTGNAPHFFHCFYIDIKQRRRRKFWKLNLKIIRKFWKFHIFQYFSLKIWAFHKNMWALWYQDISFSNISKKITFLFIIVNIILSSYNIIKIINN